jgi:hypothetical protein
VILLGTFQWLAKQISLEEFLIVADALFLRRLGSKS